jgi:rare lipoprotein A
MLKSIALSAIIAATCAYSPAYAEKVKQPGNCGKASWYALTSRTASGERMNASLLTAAHRSLKFGTKLRVVNKHNGKSVIVRINDRGPFIRGRVLDISKAAAQNIGMVSSGVGSVCYEVVSR